MCGFKLLLGVHLFGRYAEFLMTNVALFWCNGDAGSLIHRLDNRWVVCEASERLAVRGMLFMRVKVGNAIATTNEVRRLAVSPNLGRFRFCRVG
jgi:hypothetical protein